MHSLRARLVVGLLALAAAAAVAEQLVLHRRDRGAELHVGAVEQERALLGVGDRGEQQQPDGRHREHGHDQPRAQRGHHVRGVRSA